MQEKLFAYLKETSLHKKLMLLITTSSLVILSICISAILLLYRQSVKELTSVNLQLNQIALSNIEQSVTGSCKDYLDSFISLETSLFLNSANTADEKDYDFNTSYNKWAQIISNKTINLPSYIQSIGVINLKDSFYKWGHTVEDDVQTFLLEKIKQDEISHKGEIAFFLCQSQGQKTLVAIRTLRNLDGFDLGSIGYAFAVIDFETIVETSYLQYVDMDNTYVCAYLHDQLIYSNQADSLFHFSPSKNNTVEVYEVNGQSYLPSTSLIKNTGICLYTFQNVSALQHSLWFALVCSLFVVLVSSFAVLFYTNAHIHHLLIRLDRLTKIIHSIFKDNIYHNDVSIDLAPFSEPQVDELTMVAKAYKEVYDKTNELITENLMRKLLFQEQQFMVLQSQINPHFLYNTLDTIKVLSQDPTKRRAVSELVASLSGIMRYSLSKDMLSHVAEELQILRKYMVIQRTRFGERLIFTANIAQDCGNIEMPKMILQPLIENAIQYSVERKGTPSHIRLRIYTHHGHLYISVVDTGIGLPEDILDCLRRREFSCLPGHGLKNVLIRLENIFKECFTLQVRTKAGAYTAFRICIRNQTQFRDEHLDIF